MRRSILDCSPIPNFHTVSTLKTSEISFWEQLAWVSIVFTTCIPVKELEEDISLILGRLGYCGPMPLYTGPLDDTQME